MPTNNLPYKIGSLLRDIRKLTDAQLLDFQLTRHEWLIIAYLVINNYSAAQSKIREYLGIDQSHLTKVLDKLEKREILQKAIAKEDRRIRIVTVHPDSKKIVDNIFKTLNAMNRDIITCLSPKEEVHLFSLLTKVQENLPSYKSS